MALMFATTPSIQKAVHLLNTIDSSKFPLLLSRILQKIHLKDELAFTEEEEEKLQGALGLQSEDLDLVISTCEFFLHQAAYHTAKPSVLAEQLNGLHLNDDKIVAITEAWKSSGKNIIEKLRQRSVAEKQLQDCSWRLNLQLAQKTQTKMKEPTALFELDIHNDSTQINEKVRIEFTSEELYAFYDKLETIQKQLDSLS